MLAFTIDLYYTKERKEEADMIARFGLPARTIGKVISNDSARADVPLVYLGEYGADYVFKLSNAMSNTPLPRPPNDVEEIALGDKLVFYQSNSEVGP